MKILILSGEGVGEGHLEEKGGLSTPRAIKARLTRERCGGDRWAKAFLPTKWEDIYEDFETGEQREFPGK